MRARARECVCVSFANEGNTRGEI
eukprot:COSAG03_NODE_16362_length_404_cov_0.754098_1_plen_23_part_10